MTSWPTPPPHTQTLRVDRQQLGQRRWGWERGGGAWVSGSLVFNSLKPAQVFKKQIYFLLRNAKQKFGIRERGNRNRGTQKNVLYRNAGTRNKTAKLKNAAWHAGKHAHPSLLTPCPNLFRTDILGSAYSRTTVHENMSTWDWTTGHGLTYSSERGDSDYC